MWQTIAKEIAQATETSFEITDTRSVGGGCINQGYKIIGSNQNYFVKLNQANQIEMFTAEALGLKQMAATKTLTIPKPICSGVADNSCYLVLEWLNLGGRSNQGWLSMGKQLAQMHQYQTKNFPNSSLKCPLIMS